MQLTDILFYFFSAIAAGAATGVILSKHPVHAVLSLVLTFVATAVLWLLAQAEFLAIVLVLVYVGAVMVLFLFVVMMLNVEIEELKPIKCHLPIAIGLASVLFALLTTWILRANSQTLLLPITSETANVQRIGYTLFTEYVLPFEIAGVILWVAIIAAIVLTFRGRQGLNKSPSPSVQLSTTKESRLTLVKMKAEPP